MSDIFARELGMMWRGQAARLSGAKQRVFDWIKAAELIRDRKPTIAEAGLAEDWGHTGDTIWQDGKPYLDGYTYLSSNWATPILRLDGEKVECWRSEDEAQGWNSGTKWPEEAVIIVTK